MSELPAGWVTKRLDEVAEVTMGQSPPGSTYNTVGEGLPFYQGKSDFGDLYPGVRMYCTAGTKFADRDDVLLSVRAPVGPTNLARERCIIGRGLAGLRARAGITQRYLLWALRANEHVLAQRGAGSTFAAISGKQLRGLSLPVATIDEQGRIVDVLEDHLSRLEAGLRWANVARARAHRIEFLWLHKYVGSPPSAELLTLGQCLSDSRGGWSRSSRHVVEAERGTPYLKMHNITRDGGLSLQEVASVATSQEDIARYGLREGDVLFNSKNSRELVGKSAVATAEVSGWVFNENIMRLRFEERLIPEFVNLWFRSPIFRSHIESAARASTNVAAVYRHQLINMPIWVPSLNDQGRLLSAYGEVVEGAQRLRSVIEAQSVRQGLLRRALLSAAFSGQLTGRASDMDRVEELAAAGAPA